uniref:Type III crustin cruIII-4 n=1 Tax=Penaeus vannamei TaxID=6689 RepID=A0A7L9R3N3_PENVA|nr:type III crustin cruIII-4 [Penaeus vannamei]
MKIAFWTWILAAVVAAAAEDSGEGEAGVWSEISGVWVGNPVRHSCPRALPPCTFIPSYKPICYSARQCQKGELCCWDRCLGHRTCVEGAST